MKICEIYLELFIDHVAKFEASSSPREIKNSEKANNWILDEMRKIRDGPGKRYTRFG